jgi:hypothetical protein
MNFDDMVAADLERLTDEGSDLGLAASFLAAEAPATEVPIRLVFGDPTDGLQAMPDGVSDNIIAPATTRTSAIVDAIGRPPQAGDSVRIATGAMAGEWSVVAVALDQGDGSNLSLRREGMFAAGRVGGR